MSKKQTFSAFDLLSNSQDFKRTQLLEGVFESDGLACLAGPTDSGKSMLLRDFCIAIAEMQDTFLGFKLNAKHNSALFVSTEDGKQMTTELLSKQYEGLLYESTQKNLRFIFNPENVINSLSEALEESPVDLVVLDCFGDIFEGDSNKSNEIRVFLKPYLKLSEKYQCLFLILHHTNKRSEYGAPSKHNLHGGQGFQAKMRTVVELRIDPTEKYLRHFCIVKGNYLPTEQKDKSFVLHFDTDNLRFISKGERAEYSSLYEPVFDFEKRENFKKAFTLKMSGLKHKEIAPKIGVSESTVSRLLKEGIERGWDSDDNTDEETELFELV
jgi:hypothetical protein